MPRTKKAAPAKKKTPVKLSVSLIEDMNSNEAAFNKALESMASQLQKNTERAAKASEKASAQLDRKKTMLAKAQEAHKKALIANRKKKTAMNAARILKARDTLNQRKEEYAEARTEAREAKHLVVELNKGLKKVQGIEKSLAQFEAAWEKPKKRRRRRKAKTAADVPSAGIKKTVKKKSVKKKTVKKRSVKKRAAKKKVAK